MRQVSAILFGVFLFCLPWQLRLIIPMDKSFEVGMFLEYVSGFIYFSDLIFLILLLVLGFEYLSGRRKRIKFSPKWLFVISGLMLLFALLSTMQAVSYEVVLFRSLKLLEGILLLGIFRQRIIPTSYAIGCFAAGMSLQAVIGILQYTFQSSLGLFFLGETLLNTSIPGVANIDIGSKQILRAYGTFPHPNLFAAGLVISFMLLLSIWRKSKKWWLSTLMIVHLIALFVTYSRSAWLAFLLAGIFLVSVRFEEVKKHMKKSLIVSVVAVVALSVVILLSWPILSVRLDVAKVQTSIAMTDRTNLFEISGELVKDPSTLVTGVGLGNFTLKMGEVVEEKLAPWDYQPIHNVFVLILVEMGLLAFISFIVMMIWLWRYMWRHLKKDPHHYASSLIACGVAMFVMMNFDHFFWDLQQGHLMLWMVIGLTTALEA